MRVEVIQELEAENAKLELPWVSPLDPHLRYIDLKEFPEQVEQLEECRKYPPFARLLRQINAHGSILRSAKCDAWATGELDEDERLDFNLPFKMGSYVDVIFDRPEFNSELSRYLRLGDQICQALRPFRARAQSEIAVRACLYHSREIWGYSLTVFVHAYGASLAAAREEWTRAIKALGNGLAGIKQGAALSPRAYPVRGVSASHR